MYCGVHVTTLNESFDWRCLKVSLVSTHSVNCHSLSFPKRLFLDIFLDGTETSEFFRFVYGDVASASQCGGSNTAAKRGIKICWKDLS